MKHLISFFTLGLIAISIPLKSQVSESQEIKDAMWKNAPEEFKRTDVAPEFKDESAVIIGRKLDYEVKKEVFLTYLYENYSYHERVKILDKPAIEEYSTLEFNFSNSYNLSTFGRQNVLYYVGVKIVKPDGEEIEINVDDAVVEEIKMGQKSYKVNKIAIPDLEVGDIVDYYFVTKHTTYNNVVEVFEPWLYSLVDQYPIMKNIVELRTLRKCYTNIASLNGAPEFVKTDNEDVTTFVMEMDNIEKGEYNRWFYPYRQYPAIKFQAFYFTKKGANYQPLIYKFIDKENIVRKSFTEPEIQEFLGYLIKSWKKDYTLNSKITSFLSSNLSGVSDPDHIIREAVNYARQEQNRKNYIRNYLYWDNTDDNQEVLGDPYYNSNFETVATVACVLSAKKIPYDLFLTTSNITGTIDEYVLPADVVLGVHLKGSEDHYVSNVNRFSFLGEIQKYIQGNRAYAVPVENYKVSTIKEIELPINDKDFSKQVTYSHITIEDMDSIHLSREVVLTGYLKYYYQNNLITSQEYLDSCRDDVYGYKTLVQQKLNKRKKESLIEKAKQKEIQNKEDRLARHEKMLLSEYHLEKVNVKDFELVTTGMWPDSPVFTYKDSFSTDAYINQAGPNYLLEVGKFLGGQVKLSDEELEEEREGDIYQNNLRQFEENLSISIPEGYKPVGIEELNISVSNEAGTFKTEAEFLEGVLTIKSAKAYHSKYLPAEKWGLMKEFIKAASDFTEKKVLLEKIN